MYEYEDMYYENMPDELSVKINDILLEEVNNRLGDTINELDRLRKSDKEKQQELYQLRRELESTKQNYEKQMKVALLEKEKEVKRNIFHGFTIGDNVFFVDARYDARPCTTCLDGKLKAKSIPDGLEVEVKCPKCNGGKISEWVYYVRKGTIFQINFKTWYDESSKCTESSFWLKADKGDSSEKKSKDIFKTEEEAVLECEVRNANKK